VLTLILAVRLTFRKTEKTFADAAAEIDAYFKETSVLDPAQDPPTASISVQSDDTSNTVKEVTGVVSNMAPVEPKDNKDGDATISGMVVDTGEHPTHHAPPRHGIVPPQIFQAMAESKETSQK